MQEQTTSSTTHFSPRASLAAIGLKLRELKLIESITQAVKIPPGGLLALNSRIRQPF